MSEPPTSQVVENGADEVRDLTRTLQYDRYIAALLMPKQYREALLVLAAFAAELQRIPYIVNEPMMAAIRFQWWRDQLIEGDGAGRERQRSGHHLCDALVSMARSYNLPFGLLQGIIDAAETENDASPFREQSETQQVLVKFEGALFELAGRILGAEASRAYWSEAALAYGGARLAAEYQWRRKAGAQTYLSEEMNNPHDAFASPAREALARVSEAWSELDRGTKGTLLPLATVAPLLRRVATLSQQKDATNRPMSDFARARSILWVYWRGLK